MKASRIITSLPVLAALILLFELSPGYVLAQVSVPAAASSLQDQVQSADPPQAPRSQTATAPEQRANVGDNTCVPDPRLALSCKTIMVDPGHGGFQAGAVRGKVYEKDITLSVALKLAALLRAQGATVLMTRTTDVALSLHDRAVMSNQAKPDIFVSIHVNSNTNSSIHGVETYYYKRHDQVLAEKLLAELSKGTGEQANWARWDDLFVLDWNTQVAALAEVGYLSHGKSLSKLVQDSYQQQIAQSLCNGIDDYFKVVKTRPAPAILQMPVPLHNDFNIPPDEHVHEANLWW